MFGIDFKVCKDKLWRDGKVQEVLNLMKRINILKNINIWLLDSIQLVADFIFKKVFCRKKESAFFSASMKTGVKLLGGTVTRVCEYSLRHS